VVVVGHYGLNHVYRLIAMTGVREAMTASALLTVIGVAIAMEHAGLSAALGAFIAGVILADSEYRHQIEADLAPFVGLLLGLFFITIGMSLDIYVLRDEYPTILLVAAVLVAVKLAIIYVLARRRGLPDASSRRLAIVLSQGGEFAFVLLSAGAAVAVLEPQHAKLLSLAVTLSMISTPLLLLADDLMQKRSGGAVEPVRVYDKPRGQKGHVIVAGLGRFGQIIARILSARKVPFIALDTNAEQIDSLKNAGYTGYYGDASRLNILRAARIDKAAGFVIAVNDAEDSLKIARIVRQHYPDLPIFARARDRNHVYNLMDLGITIIRRETFLSAVEMTRDILSTAYHEQVEKVDFDLQRFMDYDRKRLYDDYKSRTDADRQTVRNRPMAEELAELFATDAESSAEERD
jgi:glutathione-regulated potassium-efflux system protein KefB